MLVTSSFWMLDGPWIKASIGSASVATNLDRCVETLLIPFQASHQTVFTSRTRSNSCAKPAPHHWSRIDCRLWKSTLAQSFCSVKLSSCRCESARSATKLKWVIKTLLRKELRWKQQFSYLGSSYAVLESWITDTDMQEIAQTAKVVMLTWFNAILKTSRLDGEVSSDGLDPQDF